MGRRVLLAGQLASDERRVFHVSGNHSARRAFAFSRRDTRPSFACVLLPLAKRGRREGRVAACTRGPRAKKSCARRVDHRYRRRQPTFPARRFTAYFALSSVNQRLPPSSARCVSIVANLSACMGAPGPHDFAVRVRAARPSAQTASTAFRTACRDDRDTPLVSVRNERSKHQFL